MLVGGCRKQPTAPEAGPETTIGQSAQAASVATDPVLKQFEQRAALILPAGAKALANSDGGLPDASLGFYEWVIFSPTPLSMPGTKQSATDEPTSLPLTAAVGYVEAKMAGAKIEAPQTALYTKWQANGFEFNATCVRSTNGEYLMVQQFRQK